jgi:IS605 OrfB family transposase
MEDLDIKSMTESAKGTVEQPGKDVRKKSNLNKAILDVGLGMFRQYVEYKVPCAGGRFVKVNPAYTSQTCHACGHCSPDNRKTQAKFLCVSCGHTDNADHNAALNIEAAGLAVIACGGDSPVVLPEEALRKRRPVWRTKQEPPEAALRSSSGIFGL